MSDRWDLCDALVYVDHGPPVVNKRPDAGPRHAAGKRGRGHAPARAALDHPAVRPGPPLQSVQPGAPQPPIPQSHSPRPRSPHAYAGQPINLARPGMPSGQGGHRMPREAAPVFVDATGRRRIVVRYALLAAALLLTVYFTVVGVGLLSGADVPLTPGVAPPSPNVSAGQSGRPARSRPTGREISPVSPGRPSVGQSGQVGAPATTAPTVSASTSPSAGAESRARGRTKSPNPHKPGS
jgi:hypothetical protein